MSEKSIRMLVEQTHNFYSGQDYFMLKQTISNIENFLFVFNPYTKYELCRYWQKLEEQGYDPVNEYNKRLETFDMVYNPTPKDLFVIMLQISRFLKEFAEFETKHTPQFRHPYIRGKTVHRKREDHKGVVRSISVSEFLKGEHQDNKPSRPSQSQLGEERHSYKAGTSHSKSEKFEEDLEWPFADEEEEHISEASEDEPVNDLIKIEYLREIGLDPEVHKMKMTESFSSKQGLQPHEQANVEVPSGHVL